MKALRFTLDHSKIVNAADFFSSGHRLIELLDSVTEKPVDWIISGLRMSSAVAEFYAVEKDKVEAERAFTVIVGGLESVGRGERPKDWSPDTVALADSLVKDLTGDVDQPRALLTLVQDKEDELEIAFTQELSEALSSWKPLQRLFSGSVRGRLVGMSVARGNRATLKHADGYFVQVRFDSRDAENMRAALLQDVELIGVLKKDVEDRVFKVSVEEINVLEDKPRMKWPELFGSMPDFTGDMTTEEFLAVNRGEE